MRELSLNILDIAENSVRAGADFVKIGITTDTKRDILSLEIWDNGCGMDQDLLKRVTDPFATTRTTRSVGLGLPLLKMDAEQCGGSFLIESELGQGTHVSASYGLGHIDRPPLGDLADTITTLIVGAPTIRWVTEYRVDDRVFVMDTDEIKSYIGDIPIETADVLVNIKTLLRDNIQETNGGLMI